MYNHHHHHLRQFQRPKAVPNVFHFIYFIRISRASTTTKKEI
jgi:hypothetical protein